MRSLIVVDKSYLRGATRDEVRSLFQRVKALMPEDLFFELLTGDLETRTKCFRKLPKRHNPLELLPNVGTLLRYEVESQRCCSPILAHRIRITYEFNRQLAEGSFVLTEEQVAGVEEWGG